MINEKGTKQEETTLSKAQIQNTINLIQYTPLNFRESPKPQQITNQ
jgi:hypothetical protein